MVNRCRRLSPCLWLFAPDHQRVFSRLSFILFNAEVHGSGAQSEIESVDNESVDNVAEQVHFDSIVAAARETHPGVSRAIQELAGHADLATTQRYMHLSPAATEDAIRLLEYPADVQPWQHGGNGDRAVI